MFRRRGRVLFTRRLRNLCARPRRLPVPEPVNPFVDSLCSSVLGRRRVPRPKVDDHRCVPASAAPCIRRAPRQAQGDVLWAAVRLVLAPEPLRRPPDARLHAPVLQRAAPASVMFLVASRKVR